MSKKILSVGYEIPGYSDDHVAFGSEQSLMEADILLVSPESLVPSDGWVSFTVSDGGCYNIESSKVYKQKVSRLKKEMQDHLNAGKNVFVLLTKKEEFHLAVSVSLDKKTHNYTTETYNNYCFLPIDIGAMVSASGSHIEFSGSQAFSDFYKSLKSYLKYQLYIESPANSKVIFVGKDKNKILGAYFKVGAGYLVVLPYIDYDYDIFTKTKKDKKGVEKTFWTDVAVKFGNTLVGKLVQIDRDLQKTSENTPPPEWSKDKKFLTNKEMELQNSIKVERENISEINKIIQQLGKELSEEQILKGLLFEQGKPLESAVTKALRVLGYTAEGYDDGVLELDQVIISPEGNRYIGECEGKDNKDIDIDKFRQLVESMNADFDREDVSEKALGILFGNPQRLMDPAERTLDFTKKCKIGAGREKIALIKTPDLFTVAKYVLETKDEVFKKLCRGAIHSALGAVVVFPEPKTNK